MGKEFAGNGVYGQETARSLHFFNIGSDLMPIPFVEILLRLKSAAARVNAELGIIPADIGQAIRTACEQLLAESVSDPEEFRASFPLRIWQTGSGTQTHMNVNEVIAIRASKNSGLSVHPNDHVNAGQSSNDVIPTAMDITLACGGRDLLLPALDELINELAALEERCGEFIKVGRTHLQDATPVTVGQEASAWRQGLVGSRAALADGLKDLLSPALGGTAVGSGLNTHPKFAEKVLALLGSELDLPLVENPNKFHALSGREGVTRYHGVITALATGLQKMANDIRLLASGPRCGIGEYIIPANEKGSSIMPGKVNPTQCEAMVMVTTQVMANNLAVGMGSAGGQLQLNAMAPLILHNIWHSTVILSDAMRSFARYCVAGMTVSEKKLAENLERSLMNVTALTPHIGYDKAAKVVSVAAAGDTSLIEAVLKLGYMSEADARAALDPSHMLRPDRE
ncbi:MAG: class II fumarate hydratase [Clostridiaceae bacterium]|nr:class II fumarate hydratase [Clostridiaceae bacterium]